jgi:hypothetical protein
MESYVLVSGEYIHATISIGYMRGGETQLDHEKACRLGAAIGSELVDDMSELLQTDIHCNTRATCELSDAFRRAPNRNYSGLASQRVVTTMLDVLLLLLLLCCC